MSHFCILHVRAFSTHDTSTACCTSCTKYVRLATIRAYFPSNTKRRAVSLTKIVEEPKCLSLVQFNSLYVGLIHR